MIDLRSDTVTKPSFEMRKIMYDAEVGDDVYFEDKIVNELQEYVAGLFGKEAGLFVPSGTMSNQLCLKILTQPGDEVICEENAHIFHFESGSPAMLSGLQMYPIRGKNGEKGTFDVCDIESVIRPVEAYYMAKSKVIEIENTNNRAGGTVFPIENIQKISEFAKSNNLLMHLDGARIWNAHVTSGVEFRDYGKYFDTISVCLSKGLGAPIGSVLLCSKERLKDAIRFRKAWGGGMRQVGVIASAGLFAVKNNIKRLRKDHDNAKLLAKYLSEMDDINCDANKVETNIVVFELKSGDSKLFISKCREMGLLLSEINKGVVRAVTHLDVTESDIISAASIIAKCL